MLHYYENATFCSNYYLSLQINLTDGVADQIKNVFCFSTMSKQLFIAMLLMKYRNQSLLTYINMNANHRSMEIDKTRLNSNRYAYTALYVMIIFHLTGIRFAFDSNFIACYL
jgi:hypothetical protein